MYQVRRSKSKSWYSKETWLTVQGDIQRMLNKQELLPIDREQCLTGENKPGSSASSLLRGKTRTRKNWSCILSNLKTKGKSFLCINLEKHLT